MAVWNKNASSQAISLATKEGQCAQVTNDHDLRAPFAKAVAARHWSRIIKWESENICVSQEQVTPQSRGEWIDDFLNTLLSICDNYGFSVLREQEQELRDELFDYIKSVSY